MISGLNLEPGTRVEWDVRNLQTGRIAYTAFGFVTGRRSPVVKDYETVVAIRGRISGGQVHPDSGITIVETDRLMLRRAI